MTRTGRLRWFLLCGTLAVSSAFATTSSPDGALSQSQWAADIWESAHKGDQIRVERLLNALPDPKADSVYVSRYLNSLQIHRDSLDTAAADLDSSRQEAVDEMQAHLDEDELTQAIRSAIKVQDLYDDFDDAFGDDSIKNVIVRAEKRLDEVEEAGNWLVTQELLYLLRTMYEDTDRVDSYDEYDEAV